MLLKAHGHEVSGLALEPPADSLFLKANIASDVVHDLRIDIRDRNSTIEAFKKVAPDYVIHLAAQALVRDGYRKPFETYETNVNGTMHVLEASDQTGSIKAQLIVTTDKVYRNDGRSSPYVESDPLGGKDPYSASKAMADIMAQEWLGAGRSKPGAIARAGNVIGAGDTARDRLIPDIIRSVQSGNPLHVRYPQAVRPWQHVLDCLTGYIDLVNCIGPNLTGATFNFGPALDGASTVIETVKKAAHFLPDLTFEIDLNNENMAEDPILTLDSSLSRGFLGWHDFFAENALELSLEAALPGIPIRAVMQRQILGVISNMKKADSRAERGDTEN